jgi:sensory rhodopsin
VSPAASPAFFAAGAVVMTIGTLAFVYVRLSDPENGPLHTVVAAVAGVAALAYASMALGVGLVTVGESSLYLGRYVQWIVGTPLIVVYLGMLAGAPEDRLWLLVAVDVLAMGTALGAALTTGTVRWAMFGVGTLLYLGLLYGLLETLANAAEGRPGPVRALFTKLRNLTVVTWSFYPVVWVLGPLGVGLLDPFAEVLLVTYLDVVAKIGLGFIAVNSRIALENMPRVDSLSAWRDVLA